MSYQGQGKLSRRQFLKALEPIKTAPIDVSTVLKGGLLTRRQFMKATAGLALAGAGLAFLDACASPTSKPPAAELPPETTTLRLIRIPSICQAAQHVAEDFLREEGFTDVQYIKKPGGKGTSAALASGEADLSMHFAAQVIIDVEAGDPVVILAGGHVGCFELFGTDQVRAIRDLKGKTVAVLELGSGQHVFISTLAAYVGLDPGKDINFVTHPSAVSMQLLAEGKIDAFLGFPPEPQELRAKKIGHVVVNSMVDRPWSQYFCCMVAGNRGFVQKHPVATKRALRAILKGADVCAREPERAARFIVDKGYTNNYEYALELMKDLPYGQWREYDPEDTVRFYALRLREAGMIKSSPQKIIAQGTDWRFLNEIKKEQWAST
jgi:NitT/TauT family transport system substrate-binding protein